MEKYKRIIYWSNEDARYLVEVPALPGCMSDGKTVNEAMKNTDRVIDEWISFAKELGREIPAPDNEKELALA